jgi:hypothetical protein
MNKSRIPQRKLGIARLEGIKSQDSSGGGKSKVLALDIQILMIREGMISGNATLIVE